MVPAYLYKITNLKNSKVYIGMTIDPKRRWREHCTGNTGCHKLVNAFNKYGLDNFEFRIMAKGSIDYISELEMKAIVSFDSIDNGYNIHHGSTIIKGFTASELYTTPVYVSGYWFPCAKIAMISLNMSSRKYKSRRDRGILHQSCDKPIKTKVELSEKDLISRVPWGSDKMKEKKSRSMKGKNSGELNGMFGKKNTSRSRKVVIYGVEYESITDAVRKTEFTKSQIEKRLKKGVENFSYT